ncbi:predicted protein, partial [Nematostella vectensis]
LNTHNAKRAIHNAPKMTLKDDLNKGAQDYAVKLAAKMQAGSELVHSANDERPNQGENLAWGCYSGVYSCVKATTEWYNEVKDYDFNNPGFSGATGHFTQVVWKGSSELGVGRAKYKEGANTCYVVVGRYRPPGNMAGAFPANVLKGSYSG